MLNKNLIKGFLLCGGLATAATFVVLSYFSKVTLTVDGRSTIYRSFRKGSIREFLDSAGVSISSQDIIQPEPDEKVHWGEQIRVLRVREEPTESVETVDFVLNWKSRTTRNLRKVEIQHGYRRIAYWTNLKIFHDGRLFETRKKLKKIKKIPVERIVLFAQGGYAEKIYDLSRCRKKRMVATAYWEGDPQVPGVYTYLDQRIRPGLVAVDPRVIPLRSRLYIPGYGYAYASDTGSAIKGKRIDLVVPNKEASRRWDYKKVTVYILEKAKTW